MSRLRTPRKLPRSFYTRPAAAVAPDLIGKIIIHKTSGEILRARIVETEAYAGPEDLACHSSKGLTKRTEILFGPPGRAYVYLIYGMHEMFNIVTGETGGGQAVLIRAAEPLDDWPANLTGPGRFAKAMQINRTHNSLDLTGDEIFLADDSTPPPPMTIGPRVGIDYSKNWKDAPLRFYVAGNKFVSRPRS